MGPFKHIIADRLFFSIHKTNVNSYKFHNSVKFCCTSNVNVSSPSKSSYTTFEDVLKTRRAEACKSVIFQVKNANSYNNLCCHLQKFGSIEKSFFYTLEAQQSSETRNDRHFILVEFAEEEALQACLESGHHHNTNECIPVRSPFMWFQQDPKSNYNRSDVPELRHEPINMKEISLPNLLSNSKSFSDDMIALYNGIKLNDLGSRLRFITAYQLESAFKGLFPLCSVLPFGSSINGFGKLNCDLDLVLTFEDRSSEPDNFSRFIFHSKSLGGRNQRHLEIVGDLLQFFLPGCSNVKRILRARVPILRYKQDYTDIDCDVSSTNLSGVYMSELLYLLGIYDWRVCPLVFSVRCWAQEVKLTNPSPGKWITNFSLTLLVLFYLQYEKKMIPTLETLIKHRRLVDKRSFDNIDCSFLRNLNHLPKNCVEPNDSPLTDLLHGFFEFYSNFDFNSYAISLISGCMIHKPEYSPMYLVNPLERHLNVSKNVSPEECERIRTHCRNAAWIMEFGLSEQKEGEKWGFLNLLDGHKLHSTHRMHKPGSMKNSDGNSMYENMGGNPKKYKSRKNVKMNMHELFVNE